VSAQLRVIYFGTQALIFEAAISKMYLNRVQFGVPTESTHYGDSELLVEYYSTL